MNKIELLDAKISEVMDSLKTRLDEYRSLSKHITEENAHGLDKIDLKLNRLHNWPQATNVEAGAVESSFYDNNILLDRESTTGHKYLTSENTHYQIFKKAKPKFDEHLANFENPHEDTAEKMNMYTEEEIRLLFGKRLLRTEGAVDSHFIQNKSRANLTSEVRDNIDANWLDNNQIPPYRFAPQLVVSDVMNKGTPASTLAPTTVVNNFHRMEGLDSYWTRPNVPANSISSRWSLVEGPSRPQLSNVAFTGEIGLITSARYSHHLMDVTLRSAVKSKGYIGIIPSFVRSANRNTYVVVRIGGGSGNTPYLEVMEMGVSGTTRSEKLLNRTVLPGLSQWSSVGWDNRSIRVEVVRFKGGLRIRTSNFGSATFARTINISSSQLNYAISPDSSSIGYYVKNQPGSTFINQTHLVLNLENYIYTGNSKFTHLDELIGTSNTDVGSVRVVPGNFSNKANALTAMAGEDVATGTYLIASYYAHITTTSALGWGIAHYGYPITIGRKQANGSVVNIF